MPRMGAPARLARCSPNFAASVTYLIEFTARAARDLEHLYDQIDAAESMAAARWFNKL
jgi:hypothetical protein